AAGRSGERLLVARDPAAAEERLVLLVGDGGSVYRECLSAVREQGTPVLGVSAPCELGPAGAAHAQAQGALAVALRSGRRTVDHEEVGAGSLLPLLGEEAVAAFAEGLLRPLREHDRTARGDLVASLRAWLSRHGQWDAAAADLGVHRHTL